jgi:hypothetical protein
MNTVVSHNTTQKADTKQKAPQTNSAPDLATPDMAAPLPTLQNGPDHLSPRDVIRLQRAIGNRATSQFLATKGSSLQRQPQISHGSKPGSIQRLMSVKEFKKSTEKSWARRKKISKIDDALKKIQQSGADLILLKELQTAIEVWLSTSEASDESERMEGVLELQMEVAQELATLQEQLITPAPSEDQAPQTRERRGAMSVNVVGAGKKYKKDFSDFDSKQFRVSGRAPNRKIEEVKRTETEDGRVVYYAMGLVTGFNGKVPMIAPYPEPISLGDWYPNVTHINGMAVAPKSGILSAAALQESVNNALGTMDDVALGQEAVDVLYTYSAQRGGIGADLWDCIKGKVEVEDPATEKQKEIMLDAVHRKKRVTVSAHSRGTIKTDNAVMAVHDLLTTEVTPQVRQDRLQEAIDFWTENDPGIGIEPDMLAEITIQNMGKEEAKRLMNLYIQLVYAGNAVSYPSSILKPTMFVGGLDLVSMFVGSYSSIVSGTRSVGKTRGHGFVGNYVPSVGQEIAQDVRLRNPRTRPRR